MAKRVTQEELAEIEALRRRKAHLANELKETEALLAAHETTVLTKLVAGASCQAGALFAAVEAKTVCSPSYKEELIAHFEQSHGIDGQLVEAQVQARWTKTKKVLCIVHRGRITFTH